MKKIYEQTKIVKQLLGKQEIVSDKKYRKFFYMLECPVEDGVLLLNTVTYEFLFLNKEETCLISNPNLNEAIIRYLIEQYFLVPDDFNDKKFALQVTDTRIQLQSMKFNIPMSSFVILPTTGCNARCFYCFEQGAKVSNMTEQTAHDVATFIARKADKNIQLRWFGGEPLINQKAIDIICKDLTEKKINFVSTIVSNAYLFDEATIKKAVDLWKLQRLQVTLDGTEEVYNKVKNYVYKGVSSPFIRVLNNIENALKTGIKVNIRLNMEEHNVEDLFVLAKMLVKKFSKYESCYIYVALLFDDPCSKIKKRSVSERHIVIENYMNLQKFIADNMRTPTSFMLPSSIIPSNCMACSDSSTMIVPDGHLGKCEHYVDSNFYGSIYSDEIDLENIARHKERTTVIPECDDCELRSLCMHLKCCTGRSSSCDEMDKKSTKERYFSKMRNIYNKFLEEEGKV